MSESFYGLRFLLLFLIIAANGFFAAAEVSLLTVRGSRLRHLADEGNKGAVFALQLLANPERLLSVVQVGVTLASLGLGWAGEDTFFELFTGWFGGLTAAVGETTVHAAAFLLSFLLMTILHVVVGEVVPKNLGIERADRLAVSVSPVLMLFYRIAGPFVAIIERLSLVVSRMIGLKGAQHGGGHSAEELKTVVTLSRRSGLLPEEQEDMIHNVIDLDNLTVREIMVPRREIVSVPLEASLSQVLETMVHEQHSRLPVYEVDLEKIVGVVNYKDLLPIWEEIRRSNAAGRPAPDFWISRIMRRPMFVPETKPLIQMLEEFRQGGLHIAVVVDEFGTVVGLVSLEDVLEVIVGEIEDEYDTKVVRPDPEEAPAILEIEGTTNIRDLEVHHGIELPVDAGFETVAGFILSRLGEIPEVGEHVDFDSRRFTVLEMDHNRIARVRIEKMLDEPAAISTEDISE